VYDLNDTIVAISSPSMGARVIVRITGGGAFEVCQKVFSGAISRKSGLFSGSIAVEEDLSVECELYLFLGPHSYTGEDVAELHILANPAVVEALMCSLLARGLRMAGPGEFTARAYLNGKLDLAQAEAVNEIVSSSNRFQLAAAEKLLSGRLSASAERIRGEIMDCLSLLEAGLDFSEEDIEFIGHDETIARLGKIRGELEGLLAGGIDYESVIDLPAVGIAGAPNAGKSSLVNALLGEARSIVSHERQTTRDVLTGVLALGHFRCVLFDCAGLICEPEGILDELSRDAAVGALRNSSVVVFCVDVSKSDWAEDIAVRELADAAVVIPVATKSDLVGDDALGGRLAELQGVFGVEFMATSSAESRGIEVLRERIDEKLCGGASGSTVDGDVAVLCETAGSFVALTARHRQAVLEGIESIEQAIEELDSGHYQSGAEVTALMLRAAHQSLCGIEQAHCVEIDERILDRIFSRFCIGK